MQLTRCRYQDVVVNVNAMAAVARRQCNRRKKATAMNRSMNRRAPKSIHEEKTIFLAEKSLGCIKSQKNNLLDASSCFRKLQRTQNANQAAGNQGDRRSALQGRKPSVFVHANQRPESEWSKMTNMTFESRGCSRASKPKQLLLSGIGDSPPADECACGVFLTTARDVLS